MNLKEQLKDLTAKAKTAFGEGNNEEGIRLTEEAKSLKTALDAQEELEQLVPVEPTQSVATAAKATGVDSTMPSSEKTSTVAQAAYVSQFGSVEAMTGAILVDLHGKNYAEKYWNQRQAFNRYLRSDPQYAVPADVRKALSEIILTPNVVKDALIKGLGSVDSLKATMVEGQATLGGILVPVDFQSMVIQRLQGNTAMRGRASLITTSRDAVEMPVATGGDNQRVSAVRVTWVDETPASSASETNLTWGAERIPVHTVMATMKVSRNLLEDAAFNLETYIADQIAIESAIDEDNMFLTGDGVGRPEGVLPSQSNSRGLTEVNSGNASALTWDGLTSLSYGIASQYRQNAIWIASNNAYESIALLKDGDNRPYWTQDTWNHTDQGYQARLKGLPAVEQEALPSVAANTYPVIICDPSGYQIVDRIGMSLERYLDSETAEQNQVKFVMRRRLGGQLVAPWKFAVQKVSA